MRSKSAVRYNEEVRKAIMMGDEYEAFKTLAQFYREERRVLVSRRDRASQAVEEFAARGGTIAYDESAKRITMSLGDTSYTAEYDDDGDVTRYTVTKPTGSDITYLHWMWYCSIIMDRLDAAIDAVDIKLADLENDRLIKSVAKTAGTIANDVYLTAGAVAGLDLRTDEDVDPYGILRGGKK